MERLAVSVRLPPLKGATEEELTWKVDRYGAICTSEEGSGSRRVCSTCRAMEGAGICFEEIEGFLAMGTGDFPLKDGEKLDAADFRVKDGAAVKVGKDGAAVKVGKDGAAIKVGKDGAAIKVGKVGAVVDAADFPFKDGEVVDDGSFPFKDDEDDDEDGFIPSKDGSIPSKDGSASHFFCKVCVVKGEKASNLGCKICEVKASVWKRINAAGWGFMQTVGEGDEKPVRLVMSKAELNQMIVAGGHILKLNEGRILTARLPDAYIKRFMSIPLPTPLRPLLNIPKDPRFREVILHCAIRTLSTIEMHESIRAQFFKKGSVTVEVVVKE